MNHHENLARQICESGRRLYEQGLIAATDNGDEQFTNPAAGGQLYMSEYDLCLQPDALRDGAELYLHECSDTLLQRFDHRGDGTIRFIEEGSSSFCIAVASGLGERINAIHMRRDLVLRECHSTESELITWSFSDGAPVEAPEEN